MRVDAAAEDLGPAFRRLAGMDAALVERLGALAKAIRERQPGFADAVDRLVARLRETGAGICAQPFASELKTAENVPFPILTDIDNGYALSLNLAIWPGAEMQGILEGAQDLPRFQGNDLWMWPIAATFVVGRDGLIKARFVDPDFRTRMAISDLVAALRS